MPQIIPDDPLPPNLHAQRLLIREHLPAITSRVNAALSEAHLDFPVFVLIPSATALVSCGTPADPDDESWNKASEIVASVIADILQIETTRQRAIPCAMCEGGEARNAAE